MKLVEQSISLEELAEMAGKNFSELVKAVVDIEKIVMVVDAEMQVDEEALLLDRGSNQQDLWGINIYPTKKAGERIEFDSMINIRPWQNNRSQGVDNPAIRNRILEIANHFITE